MAATAVPAQDGTNGGRSTMPSLAEEKDAIREVLAEYCFCLDGDRFADMAALFTEDGVWDTAFGKGVGRGGIAALVRKLRSTRPPGEQQRGVHLVTNLVIKIDGDNARVLSTGLWRRTARQARSSVPPAGTRTTWRSRTACGDSAAARSTVSSRPI